MVASSTLTAALQDVSPGRALDVACGVGRHSIWLHDQGWSVTAVDREPGGMPAAIQVLRCDLETGGLVIAPASWDLIVCWLYWQADLLPLIRDGIVAGGIAAMAGKTSGRFATSLENYRHAFPGWDELSCGSNEAMAWFIGRKPLF